jgi:hypothetical protein
MSPSGTGVLVFGGHTAAAELGDTWMWNGEDWTQVADGGPERINHAMAFDAMRGRVVLFGGAANFPSTLQVLNDTWKWAGQDWTQRADTGPAGRHLHVMAFDAARGVVVLFGGADETGQQSYGDTWEWNGITWTQASSFGATPSTGAALAYKDKTTALFGGIESLSGDPRRSLFGDTWEWDGKHWSLRQHLGPRARWRHALVFDSGRGRLVLFGGFSSLEPDPSSALGDTWEHTEQPTSTHDPTMQAIHVIPAVVQGLPATAEVVVILSEAPVGGSVQIQLSTDSTDVQMPGPIVVAAGSSQGRRSINVVGGSGTVTLTATLKAPRSSRRHLRSSRNRAADWRRARPIRDGTTWSLPGRSWR